MKSKLLWGSFLGCVAIALAFWFWGCGGESASRVAIRSAVGILEALCAPSATVQECADSLLERERFLAEPDAGRD